MSSIFKILAVLMFLSAAGEVTAASRIVNSTSNDANTVGTLPYWLLNADDGDVIDCTSIAGQTITLTSPLQIQQGKKIIQTFTASYLFGITCKEKM